MQDADIIGVVKDVRKLITNLDSLGPPIKQIMDDDRLSESSAVELYDRIVQLSSDVHKYLQRIEQNKKYKDAVKRLVKKEFNDG